MNVHRSYFNRNQVAVFVVVVAAILAGVQSVSACSTPVYRYAMYRWFPAPYTVFYFHKSEPPSEADLEVHKVIEAYGDYEAEKSANIDLVMMDLNKDPELKRLPPFLRKAWEEDNDGSLPAYMIVSPLGDKMHRGTLDAAKIKPMVESPARDEIMKMLADGKTCVYVMLTCSDKAKNAAAEEAAQKAIKVIASGDVEFYDGELPYFDQPEEGEDGEEKDGEDAKKKASPHSVGWLKVDRESKSEGWLVRSLLTVEYDLADLDEPMIFAVFGRGRALPPYLGKGVTEDNLLDYFAEVTGACSCTVKDQNPGMDLLMKNNWDAVAEAMADRYSSDEGAQGTISDLFPNLIVPGGDSDAPTDEQPNDEQPKDGQPKQDEGESTEEKVEPADTNVEPADKSGEPESSAPGGSEKE